MYFKHIRSLMVLGLLLCVVGPGLAGTQTLDVLVLYTAQAREAAGGTEGMISRIDAAIAQGNLSLANSMSGMANQAVLRLVHAEEIAYAESGDLGTELVRLRSTSDGYMDDVHALRNQYGADVVALLTGRTDTSGIAGMGYLMQSNSASFASWAFSVTRQDYAVLHTFVHEIGHNLGAHHDPENAGGTTVAYHYSYGHRFYAGGTQYRTVMSYSPGTRISYFSTPGIFYGGTATGIADQRDNARTILNTMATVGAFRATVYGDFQLKAVALDNRVMLRWPQPTTVGYSNDLAQIRFSTVGFPTTTNEGALAYQGTNTFYLHTNVTSGVGHYYTIWVTDDGINWVEP